MMRFALYMAGVSTTLAAALVYRQRASRLRRVPVKQAAAMLQKAWADHHTRL